MFQDSLQLFQVTMSGQRKDIYRCDVYINIAFVNHVFGEIPATRSAYIIFLHFVLITACVSRIATTRINAVHKSTTLRSKCKRYLSLVQLLLHFQFELELLDIVTQV